MTNLNKSIKYLFDLQVWFLDMAKHHPDLIFCRKQPGVAIGRLCEKDDGKCVICDSYVRPCTLVRICDECNYGSYQGRCVICGGPGVSDAYYCKECTIAEKDRDGCPKIINLGSAKTDLFYERKKYGFKKRWGCPMTKTLLCNWACYRYGWMCFDMCTGCRKVLSQRKTSCHFTLCVYINMINPKKYVFCQTSDPVFCPASQL